MTPTLFATDPEWRRHRRGARLGLCLLVIGLTTFLLERPLIDDDPRLFGGIAFVAGAFTWLYTTERMAKREVTLIESISKHRWWK